MLIWQICLELSLLAILISILTLIKYRNRTRRSIYIGIAGVIISTTLIILPYYCNVENIVVGILESLLVSLKIFIMNDSYTEVTKAASENLNITYSYMYSVVIALLYLLAPLLTATFIFEYLSNIFAYIRVQRNRDNDLYLLSELNPKSLTLAMSIRDHFDSRHETNKPLIVFTCIQSLANSEYLSLLQKAKEEKFLCIKQENEILKLRKNINRKINFLEISENEDENLNFALSLLEKYFDKVNFNVRIFLFSSQPEAELLLDSTDKGKVQTRIINERQINVYNLLDKIPLYDVKDLIKTRKISILIVGSGFIGMEILKTSVWCGQMEEIELEINVVDAQADRLKSEFTFECPELMNSEYNINFYKADVLTAEFEKILQEKCKESNYIAVTLGQDDLNIKTAIYLRRHYLMSDPEYQNRPVITVLVRDEEKYKVVSQLRTNNNNEGERRGFDLKPFGSIQKLYSYDVMLDSYLDDLALNVHAVYESNSIKDNKEITRDNILPGFNKYELYRRSNTANALHIKYKLWSYGLDYVKEDSEQPKFEYILSEDSRNQLVKLEHKRWVAFQRAEGWRSATIEEVKKYMATGLNDKHRHFLAKLHPCICDFEQLQVMCDEFDPKFIEYDESYIEKLPYVLEDKWDITGEKFKIVKRTGR